MFYGVLLDLKDITQAMTSINFSAITLQDYSGDASTDCITTMFEKEHCKLTLNVNLRVGRGVMKPPNNNTINDKPST